MLLANCATGFLDKASDQVIIDTRGLNLEE